MTSHLVSQDGGAYCCGPVWFWIPPSHPLKIETFHGKLWFWIWATKEPLSQKFKLIMENSGLVWVICRQKSHNRVFWTPPFKIGTSRGWFRSFSPEYQNTPSPQIGNSHGGFWNFGPESLLRPRLELLMENLETSVQNTSSPPSFSLSIFHGLVYGDYRCISWGYRLVTGRAL